MTVRRVLPFVFALSFATTAAATTHVKGNINAQTVWTKANSPYVLTGDVTISVHASLTIEPGVVIEAADTDVMGAGSDPSKVELVVRGELFANGTASEPIEFYGPNDARDGWVGVIVDVGAKASSLSHVSIKGATTGLYVRSSAAVAVSDVSIKWVTNGVFWQASGSATLERVRVELFGEKAIVLNDDGENSLSAAVKSCVVNGGGWGSTGVEVGARVNATVNATHVVGAATGVELLDGGSLSLSNSVVAGNFYYGVRLRQTAGQAVRVFNNTIDANHTADSGTGIRVESVANASSFIVRNNLVTNHPEGFAVNGSTAPSHDHNDVWNEVGAGWKEYVNTTKGAGSISANPLYVRALSKTAPESAVWQRFNASFSLALGSYRSDTRTLTAPGAGWMRAVFTAYSHGSGSLRVSDRNGPIQSYLSGFSSERVSVDGQGPKLDMLLSSGSYSASMSGKGYEWAPFTWDYRLTQSSPVIDLGNALDAPETDADGTARPYDGDLDGTPLPDMGAYEWHENIAPTALAGPDRLVLPNTELKFDGSGSYDPDGRIVSYDWDFGDGSAHAETAKATHTYGQLGEYTVTLTVTDDLGASSFDTATVLVADNLPPVANAGINQNALVGQVVTFNGSGSVDEDGSIVAYEWDFGDETPKASGVSTTHSYARTGVFKVTLTVTDNRGATGQDSIYVVVGDGGSANQPPVAKAGGPYSGKVGESVTLDASGSSDPDGSIVGWFWAFGDGQTAQGETVSHTYASAGGFLAQVTVTDNQGATATASTLVTISQDGNEPPIARAGGNRTGNVLEDIVFDASLSSDPDGTIEAYLWDFGDGATAETKKANHAYSTAGVFLVKLVVTDDKGAIGQDSALVTVSGAQGGNKPPLAVAGDDVAANAGQKVVFNASGSSDPDGVIVAYQWDFGDGDTGAGMSASHAYTDGGEYTVTLTVIDNGGASASTTLKARINALPVARFTGAAFAPVGQELTFDASGSEDEDGEIVEFRWSFGDGAKADTAIVKHAWDAAGTYLVTLLVIDDKGARGEKTLEVTVTAVALPVDGGGCGCGSGEPVSLGMLLVLGGAWFRRRLGRVSSP